MRYLTKIDFAKRAKVSKQAVYKAIKLERVVVGKSDKIDISNPINKEYIEINVNRYKSKPKPKKKKKSKAGVGVVRDKSKTEDKQTTTDQGDLKNLSRNSLDKLKIAADIRQKQVKTEKERGTLVPRETIQKVFSKLYMIDVNQWRTLGPSLAPEIASIVGIDDNEIILKISEEIDKESFKILKQVKRLFNDFLKDVKGIEI